MDRARTKLKYRVAEGRPDASVGGRHWTPWFRACFAALALAAAARVATAAVPVTPADYRAEVERWRSERDARLRAPDGWLSVVGLSWMVAGANSFGSAPDNAIVLPAGAPAHAGTLVLEGHAVRLVVEPNASFTLNGGAPRSGAVRTDAAATPDAFVSGTLSWQVIDRGERLGVRVKDSASPARRTFTGGSWYPIDPGYRVVARLVPHAGMTEMIVPDASGGRQTLKSPGTLELTLQGKPLRLDPVLDGDDDNDQMIVFRDLTSARETYGAGRFVRALRQADGTFVVDFNRAYSPPCAFTPYATCPLPPAQNRLKISVQAGEKYGDKKNVQKNDEQPASLPDARKPPR